MQIEQTIPNIQKNSFYQKLVFQILEKLEYGKITIVDETIRHFGKDCDAIHATIEVKHSNFYREVFIGGGLGFAESYMLNMWNTDNLTNVIRIFALNINLVDRVDNKLKMFFVHGFAQIAHMLDFNSKRGARRNIAKHYDLGNNFFGLFLDNRRMYSCADYKNTNNLEIAATQKLESICNMLDLQTTDHLLEIGTGWGGLAIYAAQKYGVRVTTTTISKKQYTYALNQVQLLGLEDKITVLLKDYRHLTGTYDKLVSIEMIEAVGHQYFATYFQKCCSLLADNGLFALQAITIKDQRYKSALREVDFIKKHIFPGGCLPSVTTIMQNICNDTKLNLVELKNITLDYAKTLRDWRKRFNDQHKEITQLGFDEQFIRKWIYYFCYCEAGFLENNIGTYQFVFSKSGYRNAEYHAYKSN